MLCFGSFGSVRMLCHAEAPVFVIAYYFGHMLMGTLILSTLGMVYFSHSDVFDHETIISNFQHPGNAGHMATMALGGFIVFHGDFLILTACTRIPFSIAFPIHAGYGMVQGTLLNVLIEGQEGNPYLLFGGILCALAAIGCMAVFDSHEGHESEKFGSIDFHHPEDFDHDTTALMDTSVHSAADPMPPSSAYQAIPSSSKEQSMGSKECIHHSPPRISPPRLTPIFGLNPWVYVCLAGGMCGGLWSPLATLGREGHHAVNNPYMCQFLFMIGQTLALPCVLHLYGSEMVTRETNCAPIATSEFIKAFLILKRRDLLFGMLTGAIVSIGYTCYFISSEIISSQESFAIAHCAPLVTIFIGVVLFKQLEKAKRLQIGLVIIAALCFVAAISLIVLSEL
jgi:glucose uptake protein GlcU